MKPALRVEANEIKKNVVLLVSECAYQPVRARAKRSAHMLHTKVRTNMENMRLSRWPSSLAAPLKKNAKPRIPSPMHAASLPASRLSPRSSLFIGAPMPSAIKLANALDEFDFLAMSAPQHSQPTPCVCI